MLCGVRHAWIRLNGRDLGELGPLTCAALPGAGALALSRGLQPKSSAQIDPNEDGALVCGGPDRRLLAVVDGHHGALASELALEVLLSHAPALLDARADAWTDAVVRLVREIAARIPDRSRSRTCLALAMLDRECCEWASFGDASVFRSGEPEAQSAPNDLFLGAELRVRVLPTELWRGRFVPAAGERVALVSDGITNFHPDLPRISAALAESADDLAAARALLESAMRAGAGDNVTAAVAIA